MIKSIFFDLDESIAFMDYKDPEQNHYPFMLDSGEIYYAIPRPKAKEAIDFARALVGIDNVYILTAATKDYACNANRVLGFGFPRDHIFSREDMAKYQTQIGYGYGTLPHCTLADKNNVLIDNLLPRENRGKIDFLGMRNWGSHYMKVRDFYGTTYVGEDLEREVADFLQNLLDKNYD